MRRQHLTWSLTALALVLAPGLATAGGPSKLKGPAVVLPPATDGGDAVCDLVLDAVWATPAQPNVGDAVTFHARVRNQGAGAAGAFGLSYQVDGHDHQQWASTSGLASGQTIELALDGSASPWIATAGMHTLDAIADDQFATNEPSSTRGDNTLATPVSLQVGQPSPSPTPTPAPGRCKLSIHTAFEGPQNSAESWRFIREGRPAVVKILDHVELAAQVKALSPTTTVIGRIYISNDDQDRSFLTENPIACAERWWTDHQATILGSPAVDYWEGFNECLAGNEQLPGQGQFSKMAWYAAFEKHRTEVLAQHGLKSCIGNFALGCPTIESWPTFFPAIDAAIAHGGILGLHEYGDVAMDTSFDHVTGEGWLTGRYRRVYRETLIPQGRQLPLVITETGLGKDHGGWQSTGPNSVAQYYANLGQPWDAWHYVHGENQLLWYDSLLREDSYVLGATIFCLDLADPVWHELDIGGEVVTELLAELAKVPPPPAPAASFPDLVITGLSASVSSPGSSVVIHVTITNQGSGAVPAGANLGVGIFVDGQGRTWAVSSAGLPAGATTTLDSTTGPTWAPAAGSYAVTAVVNDIAGRIAESADGHGAADANDLLTAPLLVNVGPAPEPFADVPAGTYYTGPFAYLRARGIFSGYADGTVRPGTAMTRGQLAKVAVRALGLTVTTPATATFPDVPVGSPFFGFVETAAAHGLMIGQPDGTFAPSVPATRGEIAKALIAGAGFRTVTPATPSFADVPTSHPFYTEIETARAYGVISGYGDGTFRPDQPASRAQIAKMLYRSIAMPKSVRWLP